MPKREALVCDTTLRDGQQSPGLAFPAELRTRLARALDDLGVAVIEAGSPAMGPAEREIFSLVRKAVKKARVSAWNRLNLADVQASAALGPDLLHVSFPASERQTKKTGLSFAGALDVLEKALSFCASRGLPVRVGLEDVSRASPGRQERLLSALRELGVAEARLADTVGILAPLGVRGLVEFWKAGGFLAEFHAHNDLGMAAPNSLVAALSGADVVDCTLNGVGERAGNCPLGAFLRLLSRAEGVFSKIDPDRALALEREFLPALDREGRLSRLFRSPGADITNIPGSIPAEPDWVEHGSKNLENSRGRG
ncbi:MAG: homocitrate synthase [Deltaproteobacteria bacterium]|nr:homocitrate synthase [Deltaproteobacteria bacterium]